MPIRGYIIEKYNTMTNAYTCNRLVQEASALDMDLQIVGIHDTAVSPHGVINHGKILKPVDFVINRYKWGREKDAINALATRSYNPLTAYNIYINKFEQVRRLHSKAFLIPKYLLGTSRLPFSSIVEQLGLPFVGKGLESSMKKSSASGIKLLMRNSLLTTLPPRNGSSKNLSQKATAEICAFTASAEKPLPVCSAHPRGISVQM